MDYYIIVGLPAYNEEEAIPKVLDKLLFLKDIYGDRFRILVVNDGSTDNTEEILKEYRESYDFINYINHNVNQGLGRAIYTLFYHVSHKYGKGDILVTLDADNTHSPKIIPFMVDKLIKEELDVVIASRFVKGGREIGLSMERKLLSRGAAAFLKLFFPIENVHDYSCGFRVYDVDYLDRAIMAYGGDLVTSRGFECMAEILARFSKLGVRAGEYPLVLEYNLKQGESKMKVLRTIKGYLSLPLKVRKPQPKGERSMNRNLTEILISVLMGALGQTILKLGANKLGNISLSLSNIVRDILHILIIPEILIGLILFGSSFLLWIKVLTKSDLSYAYPMVSLGYVLVALLSKFLFNEPFTFNKIIGIVMIVSGVFILNS